MGLDLRLLRRADEPRTAWPYSGFMEFRRRLAAAIGIDLDTMDGFGGTRPWSEVDDDLEPLLNHSDCDGILDWSACEKVAPRLREIVSGWPPNDYDRDRALELVGMMEEVNRGDAYMVVFE